MNEWNEKEWGKKDICKNEIELNFTESSQMKYWKKKLTNKIV